MAGRPREFDRDEALSSARDLFWQRGYEGVSMADLVETLGLASARIYAAFGSKGALFREAVTLYAAHEGGFADRAMDEEADVLNAMGRCLREAVDNCTRPDRPSGCMVVSSATNCTVQNDDVRELLTGYRQRRNERLYERLVQAAATGDLKPDADVRALADHYAGILVGIAVQARDGMSRDRLLATLPSAMLALEAAHISG